MSTWHGWRYETRKMAMLNLQVEIKLITPLQLFHSFGFCNDPADSDVTNEFRLILARQRR